MTTRSRGAHRAHPAARAARARIQRPTAGQVALLVLALALLATVIISVYIGKHV